MFLGVDGGASRAMTERVARGDFGSMHPAAQTEATLLNVQRALAAAGLGLADVLKVTVYLAELERDFAAFDAV